GTLQQAGNGSFNLRVTNEEGREVLLHKQTNPEGEADDFLARIPESHTGFVAMLGMGLGYAPRGILEKRPLVQHLAVFDREPGIFLQALNHMDLSTLLSNKKLILGIGRDINVSTTLAPAFRTLQLEGSNVFHHLASFDFDPDVYQNLKEQLFSHLNSLNVGGTTTKVLGRDFFNNRFKHITTIHHDLLLEHLAGVFADVPAILVAGGPSLDQNIHLLKQAQNKALIIAVDTALPALLKNGVTPHFLTSIDPNNLTYEKFADVTPQAHDISLICSSWVNPKTPQNFPAKQTFWTFTAKPMEAWLNRLLGGKLFTGGASTVAHLNLVATDILGCDPIIFLGQDLAYPKTASHANGTVLQGNAPTDTLDASNTEGQVVRGIDGTMLRTNRSFLSMKQFFEAAIAGSKKTYINATEGGAHIEGTTVLSLQETLDTYCREETGCGKKIEQQITSAQKIDPHRLLETFSTTLQQTRKLQKTITDADKLCKSMQQDLTKLARGKKAIHSFSMLAPQHQKKLKKIDQLHKKLDNAQGVWQLLEEITMDGLQQSERERQAVATLENDPAQYAEWLRQNLKRLLNINKVRKDTLKLLSENLNKILTFHKQEHSLLNKTGLEEDKNQNRLALARLYMEEEQYSLAQPIVKELQKALPQSAEVFFFLGCISALHAEYGKSADYFQKAIALNPDLTSDSERFHQELGDEFLGYARYFKTTPGRQPSVAYMIKKGLRFTSSHPLLLSALEEIIYEDLQLQQGDRIKAWIDFITEKEKITANLEPELISRIYLQSGRELLREENSTKAIAHFK
ncbi:MAG: DUF115 domain-containing protein, partial [Spirochaetales bacterium]|nr:DUF115 domain-containing protein [Spirochaetales bacterium]